jgi:hypothetical protein
MREISVAIYERVKHGAKIRSVMICWHLAASSFACNFSTLGPMITALLAE